MIESKLKVMSALLLLVVMVVTSFSTANEHSFLVQCLVSSGFDFPVGAPDAKGYYNAQGFGKNNHLGDDWNGKGGGNTDLGDSIFAVSEGIVVFSKDIRGGWGNVVRIIHNMGTQNSPRYIESVYAHMDSISVEKGDIVKKGQKIGTIGNAHGIYLAHLHFEIRDKIDMPIGKGYSKHTKGYIDPTVFIRKHRAGTK